MNRRNCDICNVVVHRASFAKHLRSKWTLEKEKQIEMFIPERLLQENFAKNQDKCIILNLYEKQREILLN